MSNEKKNSSTNPAKIIDEFSQIMKQNNLSRISYKDEKIDVSIESTSPIINSMPMPLQVPMQISQESTPPVRQQVADSAKQTADDISIKLIKSPMIGVIYCASSPDKPPFIKIGDKITKGQDLFIIECMKTMNLVKSDIDGIVKEILVSNERPVEYDERLAVITVE